MIQRIQSIYLLITAILMAVTVSSPLLLLHGNDISYIYRCLGIYNEPFEPVYWTWGVVIITAIGSFLPFVNIFFFKKRKLQIKISKVTSILIILFYITVLLYLYIALPKLGMEFQNISYGIILPIIALIINVLATIRIKKDEKLVQSLNRIR